MGTVIVLHWQRLRWWLGGILLAVIVLAGWGMGLRRPDDSPVLAPFARPLGVQSAGPLRIVTGGVSDAPPYTLPSLRRALAEGAQALELPLRFTADGEPVVYPAADLASSTDGQGSVESQPLAALQELDAGYRWTARDGQFPFRGHGLQIPLLEEVMAAFPGVPLFVQVVEPSPATGHLDRLIRIVRRWEGTASILLAPRSPEVAAKLRLSFPEAPAVSTPAEASSFLALARWGLAAFARPAYNLLYVPSQGLTARQVEAAHRHRVTVLAGPVGVEAEAARLAALGLDALLVTWPAAVRP